MHTIILVHGMNGDATSWTDVPALLAPHADRVIAVPLPGHHRPMGLLDIMNGGTYASGLSMDDYVAAVAAEFPPAAGRNVTLVGHSMGGAVISHAATLHPDRIKGLIYVAAMLPDQDQSPASIIDHIKASGHSGMLATIGDFLPFIGKMRLVQQPAEPLESKFRRSTAFDALPRAYIRCENDDVIPVPVQDEMLDAYRGTVTATEVVSLSRSHFPQFENAPELAQTIARLL